MRALLPILLLAATMSGNMADKGAAQEGFELGKEFCLASFCSKLSDDAAWEMETGNTDEVKGSEEDMDLVTVGMARAISVCFQNCADTSAETHPTSDNWDTILAKSNAIRERYGIPVSD